MKRTFVKPQISSYSLPTASGQEDLTGQCASGSFAGLPNPDEVCRGGNAVGGIFVCTPGSLPANECSAGSSPTYAGSICSVGGDVRP